MTRRWLGRVKALEREAVELRGLIQQTNSELAELRDELTKRYEAMRHDRDFFRDEAERLRDGR